MVSLLFSCSSVFFVRWLHLKSQAEAGTHFDYLVQNYSELWLPLKSPKVGALWEPRLRMGPM